MDFVLYILTFVFGAVVGFLAARRGEEKAEQAYLPETWRMREERLCSENVGPFWGGVYGCPPDVMPCDGKRSEAECRACWNRPVPPGWDGEKK